MDMKSNRKIGRPQKKDYDEAEQFSRLLETVDYVYDNTGEIKATADELDMSPMKVKKLLITSGKLEYEETKQIKRLMEYGKGIGDIQKELGLRKSSINSYLPYSKVPYKEKEVSANADRCNLYRSRKDAVEHIKDVESLLACIELFSGYIFLNHENGKFSYEVKEQYLVINKENIKIPFETVIKAFEHIVKIKDNDENNAIAVPDDLGCFLGASYIYCIFARFGLVR